MGAKGKQKLDRFFFLAMLLAVFLLITLAPFYWILATTLKTSTEVFAKPLTYWSVNIIFDNFVNLFKKLHSEQYFISSFIVSIPVTTLVSVIALIGGCVMSRYKFRGESFVYTLLLCTQILPAVVLMIPLFQSMNNLKPINDLRSLIIVCSYTDLPYCMFMMMDYYNAIPRTLKETTQVDGCSLLQAMFRILLPAMKPNTMATGACTFVNSWNVCVYATASIIREEKYTIPLALSIFQGEADTSYGGVATACVVTSISALLLLSIIQKNLAGGATNGAVKG